MLLHHIKTLKPEIERIAHSCGADRVRVFGSTATGHEQPDSDVDLLVCLPQGYDLVARLALTQQLSDLLQRKVDLVPEHELNPHIRAQVLAEAVPL